MFSQTIREAYVQHRHFERLFQAQRDLLPPEGEEEMQAKLMAVRAAVAAWDRELAGTRLTELQAAADRAQAGERR